MYMVSFSAKNGAWRTISNAFTNGLRHEPDISRRNNFADVSILARDGCDRHDLPC